ncbi:hypothetical protein V1389_01365 [Flavobacterium rakeshii]|uniref:hypothetical protein n=1 Tax=Flavobacterium rakeshii TaxID=1038845 RepID=UPI002E7AE679|nr:hypothetical protein [Flavobacterium rakeshii]MEE1896965.1 hypothetical protein [Flavobacterium rakeshii]
MIKTKLPPVLAFLASLALLTSCTEEEERWTDIKGDPITEIITDRDNSRIIAFKVINPGEEQIIHSSVDNSNRTITVYLPSYYEYQYLEVSIDLPEGATILPAQEELIPVFTDSPATYTVTAADGSTATYTVKIIIQQPDLFVDEYEDPWGIEGIPVIPILGGGITLTGSNFIPSYEVTKVFVVDNQGNKLWQLKQYNEGYDIFSFSAMFVFVDSLEDLPDLDENTDYYFMMECYSLSYTTLTPFRIMN